MREYELNTMGHVWKIDEHDGEVDIFGYDGDTHNGPICINCGYGFCHHCQDIPSRPCGDVIESRFVENKQLGSGK